MKILLICNAGVSTSMVAQNMQEYCDANKLGHEILALPESEAKNIAQDWDILLMGPQMRYAMPMFAKLFPSKPLDSIPPALYGKMDGKGVVEFAMNLK